MAIAWSSFETHFHAQAHPEYIVVCMAATVHKMPILGREVVLYIVYVVLLLLILLWLQMMFLGR
jgi:hypothetical protein